MVVGQRLSAYTNKEEGLRWTKILSIYCAAYPEARLTMYYTQPVVASLLGSRPPCSISNSNPTASSTNSKPDAKKHASPMWERIYTYSDQGVSYME